MDTKKEEREEIIYALRVSSEWCESIASSLEGGQGRFGWSYSKLADLRKLEQRVNKDGWESLFYEEKDCYQKFLLDLKAGDYVVYINIPEWGKCTVAKVTGPYQWKYEDKDFNHRFPVDPNTVHEFGRNDASVHPALSARLKLQGRWWRIYLKDEFAELLEALNKRVTPSQRTPAENRKRLSDEIQPSLLKITQSIQHTHPNISLEHLLADVFRKVPGVINVEQTGGPSDHGADILVTFDDGFPISGLGRQSVLVVQVKSYRGTHSDPQAVEDIKRAFEAFEKYPQASMGLIISTADQITPTVHEKLETLEEKSGKPVAILVGPEVAAFLLRYGAELLP